MGINLGFGLDFACVNNGGSEAAFAGALEEHAVENGARGHLQTEADVADAEHGVDAGCLLLQDFDGVEGGHGALAELSSPLRG